MTRPAGLSRFLLLSTALLCLLTSCDLLDKALFGPGPIIEEPGDEWYQVYFTVPRYPDKDEYHTGGLDERLAAAIERAENSVEVAAYDFDLTSVANALIAAKKRRVRVRVVTDTDNIDERAVRNMKKAGIPVVDDNRGAIMHNKFAIIDGSTVWTGS